MKFEIGSIIIYEFKRPNDGRKYICQVVEISSDGWVIDKEHSTHMSRSFRTEDVIVWEVIKPRKK